MTALWTATLGSTVLFSQAVFENLQVLAPDTSRSELNRMMLENLDGLGLPRQQNEGCLFCHVGDMEAPTETWDFASDEKVAKRKARVMMAMVQDINQRHLEQLVDRLAPRLSVTCVTRYAGRTDPRPLPDVLWAAYQAGGITVAVDRYRELWNRYFGSDAYDFRVGVLRQLSLRLVEAGAYADALAMADANVELYPDSPVARQSRLLILLEQAVNAGGAAAALTAFDRMRQSDEDAVISLSLLDALGWRLSRRDQTAEALRVFERNVSLFPDDWRVWPMRSGSAATASDRSRCSRSG